MPGKVAAYRQHKRERDGNKGLREALKALFEGRFGHAEKPRCAPPNCRKTPAWPR
jgi:HemY protein